MRNVLVAALVAALVSVIVTQGLVGIASFSTSGKTETAYDRVKRTGTLRCAYWSLQPMSYRDAKTNELKGFAIDLFQELAKRLSLKVEWVEEVNFATMMAGLDAGRYDAVCTGAWLSADRANAMEYTWPYLFSSVVPIVRNDDTRFDADIKMINDKAVRISVTDNLSLSLANSMFSNAQKIQLPEMAQQSQTFLDIEAGKADVTLADAADFQHYAENNPGKLRMIHTDRPLRMFPWVIPVSKGEHDLASLINGALSEFVYGGEIEKITKRNGIPAGTYGYFRPSVELK